MTRGIKFTGREMRYIALFESVTGAIARDCIIEEELNRVIFVVKEGEAGLAIGRKGRNILQLMKMMGKKVDVIEFSRNPAQFIKNTLRPARVREVRITERPDGTMLAVTSINPRDKGIAIGRNGKNAETMRQLAKRYFEIENVIIQ